MKVFGRGKHLFPKIEKENENRMIEVTDSNKNKLENLLKNYKKVYIEDLTSSV